MAESVMCAVAECSRPLYARGWCSFHYKRWWKHGDPLKSGRPSYGEPMRFIRRVVADTTDHCVVWPFATRNGYGVVRYRGQMTGAHRVALELAYGPPPTGEHQAAHRPVICHNPLCVNPRHLSWKTPSDNMADQIKDGTHLRGERHKLSKLTEDQVLAIRADTRSQVAIAQSYGVSRGTVGDIKRGKLWGWL